MSVCVHRRGGMVRKQAHRNDQPAHRPKPTPTHQPTLPTPPNHHPAPPHQPHPPTQPHPPAPPSHSSVLVWVCVCVCFFENQDVELPVFRGFGNGGLVNPKGSSHGKTRMATKGCHSGAEKLRRILLGSRAFPFKTPETLAMCGGVPPPRVWGSQPLPRVWGSAPSIALKIIF